jgi:uncharacterized damage-inducible protein DinB
MKTSTFALLLASAAFAQSPDLKTLSGHARALQNQVKNVILRSAQKVPESDYSFKPTPEVRSFGQLLGHVADAQYLFCSAALGQENPKPAVEKTKTSKADLVAALEAAFSYCDKAYAALTDANAAQTVKFFGADRVRLGVLSFNTSHSNEHYGNLVTYMRLKGIVPPSSEKRN